jgi:hypothetical protein
VRDTGRIGVATERKVTKGIVQELLVVLHDALPVPETTIVLPASSERICGQILITIVAVVTRHASCLRSRALRCEPYGRRAFEEPREDSTMSVQATLKRIQGQFISNTPYYLAIYMVSVPKRRTCVRTSRSINFEFTGFVDGGCTNLAASRARVPESRAPESPSSHNLSFLVALHRWRAAFDGSADWQPCASQRPFS